MFSVHYLAYLCSNENEKKKRTTLRTYETRGINPVIPNILYFKSDVTVVTAFCIPDMCATQAKCAVLATQGSTSASLVGERV